MQRLSKVLAAAGVASRRECEKIIWDGRVTVNEEKILKPEHHVSIEKDDIAVDGLPIRRTEEKRYYVLNKPRGFICSARRGRDERLVVDLFSHLEERLFTVGRLDRDTTGLILVTNDGHFANSVIHPRFNIEKEYLVKVRQEVEAEHLKLLKKGTWVEGYFCKPVRVTKVRRGTLKIIVKEGKKREVRWMVANAGMDLVELKRIRLGGLVLGQMPEGHYRDLTAAERDLILGYESEPS